MIGNEYKYCIFPLWEFLVLFDEVAYATVGISECIENLVIQPVKRNFKRFVAALSLDKFQERFLLLFLFHVFQQTLE